MANKQHKAQYKDAFVKYTHSKVKKEIKIKEY